MAQKYTRQQLINMAQGKTSGIEEVKQPDGSKHYLLHVDNTGIVIVCHTRQFAEQMQQDIAQL